MRPTVAEIFLYQNKLLNAKPDCCEFDHPIKIYLKTILRMKIYLRIEYITKTYKFLEALFSKISILLAILSIVSPRLFTSSTSM